MTIERSSSEPIAGSAAWWLRMFEQCDVKYLVLDSDQDHRLIQLLNAHPEWTLDFWEREGVLFVRSDVSYRQRTLAV